MDQVTTVIYNNLKSFKNDTTVLISTIDRFIVFLKNIPNQNDVMTDTQKLQISNNYKNFYVINTNLINQDNSILFNYSDVAKLYSIDMSSIVGLSKTIQPLLNVDSYTKIMSQSSTLITYFTNIRPIIITSILTPINQQIRVLSNNDVGQTTTDSKQPSNTNSTFLYNSSKTQMTTVTASTNISNRTRELTRQQDAKKIAQYVQDWTSLKPITDALTNPGNLVSILVNTTVSVSDWINKNIFQNKTVNDLEKKVNFLFSSLVTGQNIVKANDPTTQATVDIQSMWREKARKKFGNFPFCDEYPTQVNGKWVLKNEAASVTAINIAKKQILLKMLKGKR